MPSPPSPGLVVSSSSPAAGGAGGPPAKENPPNPAAFRRFRPNAHAAAPARSTGKHVKQAPAPSAEENSAKKTFRFSIPGSYQGKH